jgi:hypothetical protein
MKVHGNSALGPAGRLALGETDRVGKSPGIWVSFGTGGPRWHPPRAPNAKGRIPPQIYRAGG